MYRPPDLTKAERDEVLDALRSSGRWTVTARLHDLDDNPHRLGKIIDGQVNGDGNGRACTLTVADPNRRLRAVEGINSGKYIVRVEYSVRTDSAPLGVDFPVFTGPLDTCQRSDGQVQLTARGKGALHQVPFYESFTVPKGIRTTSAIQRIAIHRGELAHAIDIPDGPHTLPRDFTVGRDQSPWARMHDLAASIDRLLFYDQAGRLRLRANQDAPAFTFKIGRNGYLTSMPVVTANNDAFHNGVDFTWGEPRASGSSGLGFVHTYPARPDPAHPLSAQSLAWHGSNSLRVLRVEDAHVKRLKTAKRIAHNILDRELLHTVTVTTECFPFPFIEPGDLYRFNSRDYSDVTSIGSWSLPLAPGNAMTLGWSDVRSRGVSR